MLKNPNFEQNKYSLTSTGNYKIRHDSIRLVKWICYYDRSYYENINYYDMMASLLTCLNEIPMVKATYISTEDMIKKLQELKGKTEIKFYKNISNYYDGLKNINFQTQDQDTFSKNAQGISKIYHEVLLLMKYLQTKPRVKNMDINYYDLYYTVIKTRNEKYNEKEQNEILNSNESDYINFNDIVANHYIGIKTRETILK